MSALQIDHVADGICHIILTTPLSADDWLRFAAGLQQANHDDATACLVISSSGTDFYPAQDTDKMDAENPVLHEVERALLTFSKPLLAAVSGLTLGLGAALVCHSDIIYAGESLKMRLNFVSQATAPCLGVSLLLPTIIGSRRAAELFYTAEWISAERALETGIITQIFTDNDVISNALTKANEIAKWPVSALQRTKHCLKAAHAQALSTSFSCEHQNRQLLSRTPERHEALLAQTENRSADFRQFRPQGA